MRMRQWHLNKPVEWDVEMIKEYVFKVMSTQTQYTPCRANIHHLCDLVIERLGDVEDKWAHFPKEARKTNNPHYLLIYQKVKYRAGLENSATTSPVKLEEASPVQAINQEAEANPDC